jgi:decaprenylphospho-beta-D-erythro-pentofuranosid-2-ulose 2-reductase
MIDATSRPQRLLLLGGTSQIAVAIADAYLDDVPDLEVVLAARPSARLEEIAANLTRRGAVVEILDFDAEDDEGHARVVHDASGERDVDVAVVAYGVLGDPERAWTDADETLRLVLTNYARPALTGVALAEMVKRQGHGVVVALSSVAGERPRRSNFVYGSTKAGFDAFYTGLGEALRPWGGRVLVVRPGFVHSRMTEGLDPAPLAVTPRQVAQAVVAAVAAGREQVWVPRAMRPVMSALRHVPRPLFRRLPL